MKLYIYTLLISLLAIGCGTNKEFSISGNLKDIGNGKVYLYGTDLKDTVEMKNGFFSFSGKINSPQMVKIHVIDDDEKVERWCSPINIFLDNSKIKIEGKPAKYNRLETNIKGGKLNKLYTKQKKELSILDSIKNRFYKCREYLMDGHFSKADSLKNIYNKDCDNLLSTIDKTMNWNNSITSAYIIKEYANSLPLSFLKSVIQTFDNSLDNSSYINSINEKISRRERNVVGEIIPDFKVKDINGKIYNRDFFKGKYLILDFTHYYCHWCVKEIPTISYLCDKYKKDNLVLLSINMTNDIKLVKRNEVRHDKYLKKVKLDINKLGVSPVDESDTFFGIFNLYGLPQIMFVDPDGKLIARDLRGKNLARIVNKYMGK